MTHYLHENSLIIYNVANEDEIQISRYDLTNPSEEEISYRRPVRILEVPPGKTEYLLLSAGTLSGFPYYLSNEKEFQRSRIPEMVLLSSLFGILFIALAYNLFVFLTSRNLTYIFNGLLFFSLALFGLAYSGMLEASLGVTSPLILMVARTAWIVCFHLFNIEFLNIRPLHRLPFWSSVAGMVYCIIFMLVYALDSLVFSWELTYNFYASWWLINAGAVVVAPLLATMEKEVRSESALLLYPLIILPFAVVAFVISETHSGGIEFNFFTENLPVFWIGIGSIDSNVFDFVGGR